MLGLEVFLGGFLVLLLVSGVKLVQGSYITAAQVDQVWQVMGYQSSLIIVIGEPLTPTQLVVPPWSFLNKQQIKYLPVRHAKEQ